MAKVLHFTETNMMCSACENTVRGHLKDIAGILKIEINRYLISITIDESYSDLENQCKKILAENGFEPASSVETAQKKFYHALLKGLISAIAGLTLLILCAQTNSMSMLFMYITTGLSGVILLSCGWDMYKSAFKQLQKKSISIDLLFSISTFLAFLTSILGFAFPALGLPMNLDAALMIVGFRQLGKAIEKKALQHVGPNLDFRHSIPKKIEVYGHTERQDTASIAIGTTLIIQTGSLVPLDGTVVSNPTQDPAIIDDSTHFRGHKTTRPAIEDEPLRAGVIVEKGPLLLKTTATEEESFLSALQKSAQQHDQPKETLASQIVRIFIPTILFLSAISFLYVWSAMGFSAGLNIALSILVAACPCILGVIIPISTQKAVQAALKKNITLLKPEALQNLSDADVVVLDLNGTLTANTPKVLNCIQPIEDKNVLKAIAAIEATSEHYKAKLIYNYLKPPTESKTAPTFPSTYAHPTLAIPQAVVLDIHPYPNGISAIVDNVRYTIGTKKLMLARSIRLDTIPLPDVTSTQEVIYFANEKEALGYFITEDKLRPNATQFVKALQDSKKIVKLCTGASTEIAQGFATQLGIAPIDVHSTEEDPVPTEAKKISGTTPLPKQAFIEKLNAAGHRAIMIGDGTNDSGAFHCSHVAITAKSENTPQQQLLNNHAVIPAEDLPALFYLCEIAEQTHKQIKRSIYLSLFLNCASILTVSGLFLFAGIKINPGFAAALMLGQSTLALIYACAFKPVIKERIDNLPPTSLTHPTYKAPSPVTTTMSQQFYSKPQSQMAPRIVT